MSPRVTLLRSATDPRWAAVAVARFDRTLADHAHCEKKAAASALKLVADHPERPDVVRALARLAREELDHFLAVLAELGRRGLALPPDGGDPYARALLRLARGGEGALLDRLVVSALIEARSRERLELLAGELPEPRLRELYGRFARSEAGHERLFLDLARRLAGDGADARIEVLAEAEARIVSELPILPRIH